MRVVAVVLFLVVAGCGAGDTEDPAPASADASPPSVAASPPAPATPSPPPLPEAATRNDDAGQRAFIQHWVDLVNYACATGDTEQLRAMSDMSHEFNRGFLGQIEDVYASGGQVIGGEYYQAEEPAVFPLDYENTAWPEVFLARKAGENVSADGTKTTFPAEEVEASGMILVWDENDRWVMSGLYNP